MAIKFQNVSYTYGLNTPYEHQALRNINLEIKDGEKVAIIGHTGSGKSTLLQHINGLLLPSGGEVIVNSYKMNNKTKPKEIKNLRREAGLVFQFPEYQLFEETVYKDIAFGPKNFNVSEEEIADKVDEMLDLVGLERSYKDKSPFELSGGQKRRVALCGILVMNPSILVLDEPTAGLDPIGTTKLLELLESINKTLIIATHEMDVVLKHCNRVILIKEGSIVCDCSPIELFMNDELMKKGEIEAPLVVQTIKKLIASGIKIDYKNVKDAHDLALAIKKAKDGVK